MRRWIAITFIVLCQVGLFADLPARAEQPDGHRKIVSRVAPRYPELAHRINLEGTVKLLVTVAPNGSVKSMQAVGGSPLLLKAAEDAVYGWKWASAPQESQEQVELRFNPN